MDYKYLSKELTLTRDAIIFGDDNKIQDYRYGGIARFKNLTLNQIEKLIELDLLNLDECHNASPSIREIIDFVRKHPEFKVDGYTVSPDRSDCRTSFDTIKADTLLPDSESDFYKTFGEADEYNLNPPYAWYD